MSCAACQDPGYGPKGARMESWSWGMTVDALTVGGHGLRVEVEGEGQPGYLGTARMLGEAGLLLAEEGATPERSGCLTPAIAIGTQSTPPLKRARLRFSVGA